MLSAIRLSWRGVVNRAQAPVFLAPHSLLSILIYLAQPLKED